MQNRPKILLVDDKIENIIALEKLFSGLDADFVRAISGNEALKKTLGNDFALALIDVQMPDMDGYETVELMRQQNKTAHLPVIFISAIYSEDYYLVKGFETGAVDFITKPVNPKILTGKIQVHLDLYRHKSCLQEAHDELELLVQKRTAELSVANEQLLNEITEHRQAKETLKKSEERYRHITDTITDYIYTVLVEGRRPVETNHSHTCFAVTGYTSEEFDNDPYLWIKIVVEKDHDLVRQQIEQVLSGPKPNPIEHRIIRKDNVMCWVENTVVPFYDRDNNLISYDGIIKDITERKKLEEERQKIHKLESIGVLAGGIAHDFNNLLAAIRNNIYLSRIQVNRESDVYENLESTEKIIQRAANLTGQLLTFARGGAPVKKTASIVELIKETAEFALRGSNVKCEYNVADNIFPVEVDEGQMNQVIHNLILNAAQSMPGGGAIRISTENCVLGSDSGLPLQDGRYITILIQDEGVGIAIKHMQKIFDPYFTSKEMGRGLGLSITYSIIKNHNGYILVESETGVGTTFTIYLPASEKQIEEKETAEDTFVSGEGKVLIMDDEEIIRESVEQLLMYKGYEVECAKDGDEAIALYKKAMEASEPFNVVILDLTIRGGMGGKEAVKKLREIDPDVKAIVASGYSNDPVLANFKGYGFVGVFAKHDKTEELGKTLHKVING